jgi:hypothetical protein
MENRYPMRNPTPVIMITEDHFTELKKTALDPADGKAAAYLHADSFKNVIADVLHKVVYEQKAEEIGREAFEALAAEE